nr:MAG TPA: hypothetical protein [Caudoviricetes sp.]
MITYILLPIFILTVLHFIFTVLNNIIDNKPLLDKTKADITIAGVIATITIINAIITL